MKPTSIPCLAALAALVTTAAPLRADPIKIVAAENFYGGVARQVVPEAEVTSILSNPNQDPHEFQTDAATAAAVAQADIVIYSGIGYDDWMERLLASGGKPGRVAIKVADLIGAKGGDNPHIWYNPKTMPALAAKLGGVLNLPGAAAAFAETMNPLTDKIAQLSARAKGVKVTATEPVFGYMATALGMEMLNDEYQVATMNDTDPSFEQIAGFESSLRSKTAKILFYNDQVSDPSTAQMRSIATQSGVPVVGVSETQPTEAASYVAWMVAQLDEVAKVLP